MNRQTSLLIVDDEADQRELLAGFLRKQGFVVTTAGSGAEALEKYAALFTPIALLDMKMPGMSGLELLEKLRELNPFLQAIVLTAFGSVETAVAAMKAGACDYLTKPIEDLDALVLKLERALSQSSLLVSNQVLKDRLAEVFPSSELIGESPAMQKVRELIAAVGPRDATVLITGPSGSGKEVVARALHAVSPRASAPLVAINCAAFPESLLEAELFGFEKGAFTGADRAKPGRFELAHGGTLFLDEIGDMPLPMQAKLLRVLEDRKLQRLGATREITLDIRLLAATNRPLEEMIKEKRFREDVFYRINVIRIDLPPLADRGPDLLLLAQHLIERHARRMGKSVKGLDPVAAVLLKQYHWPGNVRELDNVLERAIILTSSDRVTANDLSGLPSPTISKTSSEVRPLADLERDAILNCLDQLDWNLTLSAEKLGIHRNTLRLKIREYSLTRS